MKKRVTKIFVLSIVFILFTFQPDALFEPLFSLYAQSESVTPFSDYMLQKWDETRGLQANDVLKVAQGPDGYLWLATDMGIFRYNGIRFEYMEVVLPEGQGVRPVNHILVDRSGDVWAAGFWGVLKYDKEKNHFRILSKKEGFPQVFTNYLMEDSFGNLWIGTWGDGVFRWKDGKMESCLKDRKTGPPVVYSMAEGPGGDIWICAYDKGLFVGKDNGFSKYDIPGPALKYTVYWVYRQETGTLWIGTNHGLLEVVEDKLVNRFTTADGLPYNIIQGQIHRDQKGSLWVGTDGGLCRITRRNGNTRLERVLENRYINCIFQDREGNLWIGAMAYGLYQLRDAGFRAYGPAQGVSRDMYLLFRDKRGGTWASSNRGKVSRFKNGTFSPLFSLENLYRMEVMALAKDAGGSWWMGTFTHGLIRYKDGVTGRYTTENGLKDDGILALMPDSRGRMWAGTELGGVICLDGENINQYGVSEGLVNNMVYGLDEDGSGNIWVSTTGGLNMIPGGHFQRETLKTFLKGTFVMDVHQDRENPSVYWVCGNGGGLIRLHLADGKTTAFTTGQGLESNQLIALLEDDWNYFWISAKEGVMRVDKKSLGRGRARCTLFTTADGMPSNRTIGLPVNTAIPAENGELWFSTAKGIAAIKPDRVKINKFPPPVSFKQITFNFDAVSPDRQGQQFKGIRRVKFKFDVPTFIAPSKVKIKYRLEGFQRDWIALPPHKSREVSYRGLPFGNYTFQVIAANNSGVWNSDGASFTFSLSPYFHQAAWFKILAVFFSLVLLVSGFLGFKKYRYNWKLKQKYKNSTLDPAKAEQALKKLLHLLEVELVYREESLSVNTLAERIAIGPKYLSQIINERLQKNFRELVNGYRVEEVKQMLLDPGRQEDSMLQLALDAGFNSKEAFNKTFKKMTGMTPSEYRKKKKPA